MPITNNYRQIVGQVAIMKKVPHIFLIYQDSMNNNGVEKVVQKLQKTLYIRQTSRIMKGNVDTNTYRVALLTQRGIYIYKISRVQF